MTKQNQTVQSRRRRAIRWKRLLGFLSAVVVSVTTYALILPAITSSSQTWCGLEEHTHDDSCYTWQLVCTEQDPNHTHTEACYQKVLSCNKQEHVHEELCHSNPNEVETPEQWEAELPLEERSGVWAEDLVLIANSQLGFRESEDNFTIVDEVRQGYTRFGDWYGQRYGSWDAMFVSFCLSYADIPESFVPYASEAAAWAEALQEKGLYRTRLADENGQSAAAYQPKSGDLVFFQDENSPDHAPARVGIVKELQDAEGEARLITVEGDADGEVASCSYELDAAQIVGFAQLPERPEWLTAFQNPGRAPATETTEPEDPAETQQPSVDMSYSNSANVLRGARRNTLSFRGEDYEILARYPDSAQIPAGAWLSVQELGREDADYAAHAEAAADQLKADLTYARFFDIKIMNADGEEIEPANGAELSVEIRLLDQIPIAQDEQVRVVHFIDDAAELIEPEQTSLTEEDELEVVRFQADGFSIWGVVGSKAHEARQLTAKAEGVEVQLAAPSQARLPERAHLEAVELQPGSAEYESCYAEAQRLLSEEKGETVRIAFARFFDLTIRDEKGRELEPEAAVNVRFNYDEQLDLSLGQEMYVVHFADAGAELIETDLSRPLDAAGEETEGTCVVFQQDSFSITGTVLTDEKLVTDITSIHYGFPQMSASYYVTFDADADGDGENETYAMGYGGVVEEVSYDTDGKIHFNTGVNDNRTIADEWFDSFNWYYNNSAYFYNTAFSNDNKTAGGDYEGNFLSNDYPFATTPTGDYQGGTQSLTYNANGATSDSTYGYDFRNMIAYYTRGWFSSTVYYDNQNYTFSYNISNGTVTSTPKAKYGPMGGLSTFVVKEKYSNSTLSGNPSGTEVLDLDEIYVDQSEPRNNINRLARSLYIDSNRNIRLAMQTRVKSGTGLIRPYPVKAESNTKGYVTISSTKYTTCDAVLVLDGGYWKWVFPYEIGAGQQFPNAVKATNLQFSTGYTTDGIASAEPGSALDAIDNSRNTAPEISKSLMPNNGGDGTYSLALSVMGDSHAAFSNMDIVADVLVVADMSNSMKQTDGGSKTRLAILKESLETLQGALLSQNTAEKTAVAMNLMTFGSVAADYDRSWVKTQADFQQYINSLPTESSLQGATNWEDALERAYTILKARRNVTQNDTAKHVQYLIFLTDGDPTCWVEPNENEDLNGHAWLWEALYAGAEGYLGTGTTQPLNIYYSLLEARDDARRIVWGIEKGTVNGLDSGINDAQNNNHLNEDGTPETVTTYMYAIATMGNADTLTNLLAYAYNGSLEATYPADSLMMASNQNELEAAFLRIAHSITAKMAYTGVSIHDPCTEFTHVASELDRTTSFHYFRYPCDTDFNILDETSGQIRFEAVRNANGVIEYYLDRANGNARIDNIFEHLTEWDRKVDLTAYSGTSPLPDGDFDGMDYRIKEAKFDIRIFRTSDNSEVEDLSGVDPYDVGSDPSQGKPYYYTQVIDWDLATEHPYRDATGQPSDRFLLETGYAYTVIVTVWPYQNLYDIIAGLNNGQIASLEEIEGEIDIRYIHQDPSTGEYYYDTNLRDSTGKSMASVDYQRYNEYVDGNGDTQIHTTSSSKQFYTNPEPVPLAEYEIRMRKTWEDMLDTTLLERMILEQAASKFKELTGTELSSISSFSALNAALSSLSNAQREELYDAYRAQLVLLSKPIGAEFPSEDANVFSAGVEGEWVYYFYNGENLGACSMFFSPVWHFYGEQAGETDLSRLGRIVIDSRTSEEQSIEVSAGTLVSETNFDPLDNNYENHYKMEVHFPATDTEPERTEVYYIIEEGYDYTLRELNPDSPFTLSTEFYHPMLIDGVLYDIEITGKRQEVESHGGVNKDVTIYSARVKSSGISTLEATNRLRPQITLSKEVLRNTELEGYQTLYATDLEGNVLTQDVEMLGQSYVYQLRVMDPFTIRVEMSFPDDAQQAHILADAVGDTVPGMFYVIYPAYLDEMLAEGLITSAQLNEYLSFYIRSGGAYQIGSTSYTGSAGSFQVREIATEGSRSFCTELGADITINANQHVRIYNVPQQASVTLTEINVPKAWVQTELDSEIPVDGLASNIRYQASLSNLLLPLDLELKKINVLTTDRSTVTLSDSSTPAGTGTMYDDSAIPGLSGARFTLYRKVEPELTEENMAASGVIWLKSDGSTVSTGARPEADAVQVFASTVDYFGNPLTNIPINGATDGNGKLRFLHLLPGTYYLVETAPPAGFLPSKEYLTLTLTADGLSYQQPSQNAGFAQDALWREEDAEPLDQPVFELLVTNNGGEELPQTGGSGWESLSILGIVLMFIGASALLIRKTCTKETQA
ncbi:MAG: VWA domain-containing protein [Oscillospiraceae bacterium]|nr:VWA domain-containing protein [Oscillospiraceae bacterium]